MSGHTALIAVIAAVLSLGYAAQNRSAGHPSGRSAGADRPSGARTSKVLDTQVLEAALVDLAEYGGKDSPMPRRGPDAGKVVFHPDAATYQTTVDAVLYRHQEERWSKLSEKQLALARQAAEHLVKRLAAHDLFSGFRGRDKRIVAWSEDKADGSGVYPSRPVRAWPPGYSQDRKFAVVRLSIPWSIHHADGTYLLEERDGTWAVALRQFVFYP